MLTAENKTRELELNDFIDTSNPDVDIHMLKHAQRTVNFERTYIHTGTNNSAPKIMHIQNYIQDFYINQYSLDSTGYMIVLI